MDAQIQRIYFGDLSKYGIECSEMKPVLQLKLTGRTPVIDIGTIKAIKQGKIQFIGEIERMVPAR